MKPIIKWPGGKSSEINKIEHLIPNFNRYIEPFFGGGAVYFHVQPETAFINDISTDLTVFYSFIKSQDPILHNLLSDINYNFQYVINVCDKNYNKLLDIYNTFKLENNTTRMENNVRDLIVLFQEDFQNNFKKDILSDHISIYTFLENGLIEKIIRTRKNDFKTEISSPDLKELLITGLTSGFYMYYRKIYNDITLGKINTFSDQFSSTVFYFIREYCYGSMFRYNVKNEFNIPYGGKSYNKKNFKSKIDNMFNKKIEDTFKNTQIFNCDFSDFFNQINLTNEDFIFLDPPYDTEFSSYSGVDFTKKDQKRLYDFLMTTNANFILIIKNTEYIFELYEHKFNILTFDNKYNYNVKGRNERNVEHLIITNLPV